MSPSVETKEPGTLARSIAWWIYWVILIALLSSYVWHRWELIETLGETKLDLLIIAVLVVVALLPLATEVKVAGVQIKREVRKLRKEVSEKLVDLRQSIAATSSANNSLAVTMPGLLPTEKLDRLLELLSSEARGQRLDDRSDISSSVPIQATRAFAIRYQLEQELRRLVTVFTEEERKSMPGMSIQIRFLQENGLITSNTAAAARQVLAAASLAVHGETLDEQRVKFMEEAADLVLRELRAL